MPEALAFCTDHECHPMKLGSNLGGAAITITASVGVGGVNRDSDVRTIQQALNDVPINEGGPTPILVVDGVCGPKTRNAIQTFQLMHFGWSGTDGRVDPNGQTIAKLNQSSSKQMFISNFPGDPLAGTAAPVFRVSRVLASLDQALSCIRVARENLEFAIRAENATSPSLGGITRAERMFKVNRHFDIDGYAPPQRRPILFQILRIFNRMLQVFARPGFWGPEIFQNDPGSEKTIAFTFANGFDKQNLTQTENGITYRLDRIYLCNQLDKEVGDICTIVILHELAHFCGGPDGSLELITDHAYGWHDRPRMRSLTRRQKLSNAMNYNNFAWDARFDRKPAGFT